MGTPPVFAGIVRPAEEEAMERRREPRYRLKQEAFAVLKLKPREIAGRIQDISRGGLAVRCAEKQVSGETQFNVDILIPSSSVYLEDIPCKSVFEIETPVESSPSGMTLLCRGLKFLQLTAEQQASLQSLIREQGV